MCNSHDRCGISKYYERQTKLTQADNTSLWPDSLLPVPRPHAIISYHNFLFVTFPRRPSLPTTIVYVHATCPSGPILLDFVPLMMARTAPED